jgi:hypothetical protein
MQSTGSEIPLCTNEHPCTNPLEYGDLEDNNIELFQEFSHQFINKGRYYTFAIDEVNDPYYQYLAIVTQNRYFNDKNV